MRRAFVPAVATLVLVAGQLTAQDRTGAAYDPPSVISAIAAETEWVTNELSSIDWSARNADRVRHEVEVFEGELRIMAPLLPESPQLAEWREHLQRLAARSHVHLTEVGPGETILHKGYHEIKLTLVLEGSAESIAALGERVRRSPRIASWHEVGESAGGVRVEQSVFVAPPLDAPPRTCKTFSPVALESDARAVGLNERLVSLCKQLDERPEIRDLVTRLARLEDRIQLIAKLKEENRVPPTPEEMEDFDKFMKGLGLPPDDSDQR